MRRFFTFVITLCAILALFPLYTRFKVTAAPVPPGVHLGGLDLSAIKDKGEIRQHLEGLYAQTIEVRFGDKVLALRPDDVDFYIDAEQMVAEASRYLEGSEFLDIAVRQALGFPQQERNIPVRFLLNTEKLRAWLNSVAETHNHPPTQARVLTAAWEWSDGSTQIPGIPTGYIGRYRRDWTWLPGAPGYTLDVEASIPVIVAALTGEEARIAELVRHETPSPPPTMADLTAAINRIFADFPGFGAVYVQDLTTGAEARVDDEVAFSGMSTLKIFIAAAVMHQLANGIVADDPEVAQIGQLLDYALGESNNYAANQLLAYLGDGDSLAGARQVTAFARQLGFVNTYMQSGFDAAAYAQLPTPANGRTDWNTNPDSNLQTTPLEMGQLMAALYECTLDKGLLRTTFPAEVTPEECAQILFYMTHDQFQELIWGGLPEKAHAWIIHKHGFAFESHSDVALVWGPNGPYVMSIFLFRRGWMDWATSNSTMHAISRLTWNFYEFQRSQAANPTLAPPLFQPPPGYSKIADYIPTAATGGH
jgi:hypothetical protein